MDHYPTYHSPIRLLKDLGLDSSEINLENLKIERKRLLLELQISEDQTVKIGNNQLCKNDINELFDEFSSISSLQHHKLIFDNPKMLNFLENNKIDWITEDHREIQFESTEERQKFNDFISPYLATSIDKALPEIIRNRTFLKLGKSTGFFQMLSQSDGIYAFRKFNAFCLSLMDLVESEQLDSSIFPLDEFIHIRYYPFYDTVNDVQIFYPEITDKVAAALVNFTARFYKSEGRSDYLIKISEHMLRLKCSSDIKALIRKNNEKLQKQEERYTTINKSTPIIVLVVAISIAIAVFLALKFGGPNKSKQDSVDPIEELRNELDAFKTLSDSI